MSMLHNLIRLLAAIFLVGNAVAQNVCDEIAEVRFLPAREAAHGIPVDIESQVVWVDRLGGSFFMNDGSYGIYVKNLMGPGKTASLVPGDVVRVTGKTHAGDFTPCIIAESIEQIGHKPLPAGKVFWSAHLFSPEIDCDWIALHGRLISYEVLPESFVIVVEMIRDEQTIYLQVPLTGRNEKELSNLMFEWVKFNAVAGTVNNGNRQAVGRIFYVSSVDDFKAEGISLNDALSEVTRAQPIRELMQLPMNHLSIVKTYGTVTHVGEREIFIRGEQAALDVWMQDTAGLAVGDVVESVGLVWPQDVSPAFRAHVTTVIRKEPPPEPVRLESLSAVRDTLNYDLVEMDAKLVEVGRSFGLVDGNSDLRQQVKLLCRSGHRLFEVQLPAGDKLPKGITPGARLRLTGVCHVIRETWRPWVLEINGCWLQLRSVSEIKILAAAPWWTTARLFWFAGSTLGISLLFLIWIVLLRKTVERQTAIIGEKVEREAVLNERQRIARELHDNLEQGLAGAIFQLGGFRRLYKKSIEKNQQRIVQLMSRTTPGGGSPSLNAWVDDWRMEAGQNGKALEAVEHMLRHCSEESRSSILDLRGGLLEKMDLAEVIQMMLQTLKDERGTAFTFCEKGVARRLSQAAARNLFLVIKEAASNAVRHAHPDRVTVELDWSSGLTATVSDDGCGFDLNRQMAVGRFGLQGMKERMTSANGVLLINSVAGRGTTVVAQLPLDEGRENFDG